MPDGCTIGRSYTTGRWILWYALWWVIACADKSKGLSLSAGRLDSAAWSVACARPRSSPSLNPEHCLVSLSCHLAAGYLDFCGGLAPNLLNVLLNVLSLCRCRCLRSEVRL